MTARRIKVWLISKWFHPVLGGGAERFRRYAPGLQKRGIDLEVFTALHPDYPGLSEHEVVDDILITRIPLTDAYKEFPKLVHLTLSQLQQQERKSDIVQLFSISPKIMHPLLHMRFQGVKTVYVSTMVHKESREGFVKRIKEWLYLQASILPISQVIASTTVMKNSLISRGVFSKCIRVIPNGVDTQRFRPTVSSQERDQIRQKLGINRKDQVILFVGGISLRKGVDLLISAWSKLVLNNQNIRLILVGDYQKQPMIPVSQKQSGLEYSNRIERMVENAPSKERIIFTGEISNVEEYMRSADIFVLPSRQEGMGNVVLEAMATGLPCVLTPYIGLPTYEFGQAGREFILLDDYDVENLAFTINQLLQDKDMAVTIGQLARQWVEKHMCIDKILDQYADMYRNLATNKHSLSIER